MVQVYPADKQGRCIKGFCPTKCDSKDADRIAFALAADLRRYGIKYDHIVVEEK